MGEDDYDYNASEKLIAELNAFLERYSERMDRIHSIERKLVAATLFRAAFAVDSAFADAMREASLEEIDASMRHALSAFAEEDRVAP
ncbi:MAG: hypothetical protein ACR2Q4_09650 [Geminicoccaceae bacterium]